MKLLYSVVVSGLILTACGSADFTSRNKTEEIASSDMPISYGYNIIVAVDMSNRIKRNRRYEDPAVVKMITDNLRAVFQKGLARGVRGKFSLVTINSDDFKEEIYADKIFRIDLTRFQGNAVALSDYIYRNKGKNSLEYDLELLNNAFARFYQNRKNSRQLPADMWYFFQDKLSHPLLDTSSSVFHYGKKSFTRKYINYVILLTDGYIEADRYDKENGMRIGNQYRYLSEAAVDDFRKVYNGQKRRLTEFFEENRYGIVPVNNSAVRDSRILVLELFDRSIVDGVSRKTPRDQEIIQQFWTDWFIKSEVSDKNFKLVETKSTSQDIAIIVEEFLGVSKK